MTVLRHARLEADDLIANYARFLAEKGEDVVVASNDKDFAQLLWEGHERVSVWDPGTKAFVAKPTAAQAHDVLDVRRTLEPGVVARLIERLAAGEGRDAIRRLRLLVHREQQAHQNGDRRSAVRLSGEFHVLLADLSGSSIYPRMMRELTPLTCLAILSFEAPTAAACPTDEHARLIDAIEAGDVPAAAALMAEHLLHIEQALDLDRRNEEPEVDLADLLLG